MMQVSEFRMPGSSSGSDGRKSESSQEDANQHNDSTSQTVKYSSIFSFRNHVGEMDGRQIYYSVRIL